MIFHEKLDYNYISPGLYQGSKPSSNYLIKRDRFTCVVFSAIEYQPNESRYSDIKIINVPLRDSKDFTNMEVAMALKCSDLVCEEVKSGGKVLVTCYMGWNRSGLITALSLIKLHKMTGKQAVNHVRSMRKNALNNELFVKIIEEYGNRRTGS